MKTKSYNYKFIIGLIIGLLSVTITYATSNVLADDVYYTNDSITTEDVQSAIDDLSTKIEKSSSCPTGFYCEALKTTLDLGDFVSYTPTKTSATTDTAYTGYTSTQTINPSELNLWRVLNINDDGTVDLISEYVSSVKISFQGQIGYQNLVGELNRLARQYETEGITVGSRYFGYNGQTEYITDTSKFVNPAPWKCSTGGSCNPSPVESQGGGDKLYTTDYNQVNTVLGKIVANKVGTTTTTSYWMASRYYYYYSSTRYYWRGRGVSKSGSISYNELYYYSSSSFNTDNFKNALRPIVTLKSGLEYSGLGTKAVPMEIITS